MKDGKKSPLCYVKEAWKKGKREKKEKYGELMSDILGSTKASWLQSWVHQVVYWLELVSSYLVYEFVSSTRSN